LNALGFCKQTSPFGRIWQAGDSAQFRDPLLRVTPDEVKASAKQICVGGAFESFVYWHQRF